MAPMLCMWARVLHSPLQPARQGCQPAESRVRNEQDVLGGVAEDEPPLVAIAAAGTRSPASEPPASVPGAVQVQNHMDVDSMGHAPIRSG